MPQPRYRSKTYTKHQRTTPSNRAVIHYERKRTARRDCLTCGTTLTKKPAERALATLCSTCMKTALRGRVWRGV